jgi:WD40 repeat protein
MRTYGRILLIVFLAALAIVPVYSCYWLMGGGRSFWDLRGTIDVVTFDPLARWVALGGRDVGTAQYQDRGDVKLCDVKTGSVRHVIVLPRRPWDMAVNRDGTLLAAYSAVTGSRYDVEVFAIPPDGTPASVHTQALGFSSQDAFGFVGRYLVCAGGKKLALLNTLDWTVSAKVSCYTSRPVFDPSSERIALGQEINGRLAVLSWQLGGEPTRVDDARVPLAFLPDGRLLAVLSREPRGIGLWPESQAGQPQFVPESRGAWSGCCVSRDGRSFAAWSPGGAITVWKLGPDGITVLNRLSVPRLRYARFTSVPDVLAFATTALNPDGTWDRESCARLEGSGLWSLSQNNRVLWFADRDILVQGSFLAVYLSGLECASVWDISNLAQPKSLWETRWRHGTALFE